MILTKPVSTTGGNDLCSRCGMCCNGVLFYGVKLQASESVKSLSALGLKIKRRDSVAYCLQPCTAHQSGGCNIYSTRPVRCREFECKQLLSLTKAELSESEAIANIEYARMLAENVSALFLRAGDTRCGKDFSTRYAAVFTPPLDPSPEAVEARVELSEAMTLLEQFLSEKFRPDEP